MLLDGISYQEYLETRPKSNKNNAILTFLSYIERKLGMVALFPLSQIPERNIELIEPYSIGQDLVRRGILKSFGRYRSSCDEPPFKIWRCINEDELHSVTGGISLRDSDALFAAIAEGLERYLWHMQWDYFEKPMRESVDSMQARATPFITPERFAGAHIDKKRKHTGNEHVLTWVLGESLVSGKKTYVPAQIVSGANYPGYPDEHSIRGRSTNGLATWPTKDGARLAGILEVIERDAYVIMWLNQITPPKIDLSNFVSANQDLTTLLERCKRYRFNVHALRIPTDAPAYAVCVVVEDTTAVLPRFSFGLRAHRSLAVAIEKALFEALRARLAYRVSGSQIEQWDPKTPVEQVGHRDRTFWWNVGTRSKGLEFLINGKECASTREEWDTDTEAEHLSRIIKWCEAKSYECVAVSIGSSKFNPTPWHIEFVVIPELQPLYITEKERILTGPRLTEVPRLTGFTPRNKPFTDAPHPFY